MVIRSSGARERSVDAFIALVVIFANIVHQVEAIVFADAPRILATSGNSRLTGSVVDVVVLAGAAIEASVKPLVALEICRAKVVDKVESIALTNAAWILATIGHTSLALSINSVVIAIVGAGKSFVEAVCALEVIGAEIVYQIEAIIFANTAGVLTSAGQCC